MQTVNFNCPHCGNLMAVGMNLLGRNVRCPHCKAVVQAPTAPGEPMSSPALMSFNQKPLDPAPAPVPAPAPAPAPAPVLAPLPPVQAPAPAPVPAPTTAPLPQFNLPPKDAEAPDSIFGEVHDEDLFGTAQPKPTMPQLPPAPTMAPPPPPPPPVMPVPVMPIPVMPVPSAPMETTLPTVMPPAPSLNYDPNAVTVSVPQLELDIDAPTEFTPPVMPVPPPPERKVMDDAPVRAGRTQRPVTTKESSSTSAFAIILLAYGLLMTIAAGVLGYLNFTKSNETEHPFKAIPDVFGEYEKANRKSTSFKWMPNAVAEMPDELKVKLGSELVIGDLSVTPIAVKKQLIHAVTQVVSGEDKDRPIGRSLVLSLKVKNLSSDVSFYPMDPAFCRRLPARQDKRAGPYTMLQYPKDTFYGPFDWPPDARVRKEFVKGHESNEKLLKPGDEETIYVVAAPIQDPLGNLGPIGDKQTLLWRVQLRRGMIKYQDASGKEGEFSATAVIGVPFTKSQIQ